MRCESPVTGSLMGCEVVSKIARHRHMRRTTRKIELEVDEQEFKLQHIADDQAEDLKESTFSLFLS